MEKKSENMDYDRIIVDENLLLIEAMKILDRTLKKVLFIVRDDIVIASLSDGDIRRWILSNGDLNVAIGQVANYNPKVLHEDEIFQSDYIFVKYDISAIPIVDKNNKIINILYRNHKYNFGSLNCEVPVVIMAGGKGTRLYPYTKILPKPLIPIGEIPIVEHIINEFKNFNCKSFYMIVNHKKEMIKSYFSEIQKDYKLEFIDEDMPLGTGGGIYFLKNKIKTTFFLTNCDILIKDDYLSIYEHHKKNNNLITIVCSVKNIEIPYGVIELDDSGNINKMKEKPCVSFLANTGFYVVDERVINEMEENTAIGFPDIIEQYKKNGEKIGVYPIGEDAWMDMGQIEEMEKMRKRLE